MPVRTGHRAWLRAAVAVVDVGGGATDDVTVGTPAGGPGPNATAPAALCVPSRPSRPLDAAFGATIDGRRVSPSASHRAGRYAVLLGYRSQLEVVVDVGNEDEIGDLRAYRTRVGDTMHVDFERPARPRSAGRFHAPRARTTGRPVPAETMSHPMTTRGPRTELDGSRSYAHLPVSRPFFPGNSRRTSGNDGVHGNPCTNRHSSI